MTAPTPDILNAWREHRPVDGVTFSHDDLVTILAGEHTGNAGTLILIEQLDPEVVYQVEIDTNFVVPAKQSEIALAD